MGIEYSTPQEQPKDPPEVTVPVPGVTAFASSESRWAAAGEADITPLTVDIPSALTAEPRPITPEERIHDEVATLFRPSLLSEIGSGRGDIRRLLVEGSDAIPYENIEGYAGCKAEYDEAMIYHKAACAELLSVMGSPTPGKVFAGAEPYVSWHKARTLPLEESGLEAPVLYRVTAQMKNGVLADAEDWGVYPLSITKYVLHTHSEDFSFPKEQHLTGALAGKVITRNDAESIQVKPHDVVVYSFDRLLREVTDELSHDAVHAALQPWVERFMQVQPPHTTVPLHAFGIDVKNNFVQLLNSAADNPEQSVADLKRVFGFLSAEDMQPMLNVRLSVIAEAMDKYGMGPRIHWVLQHAGLIRAAIVKAQKQAVETGLPDAVMTQLAQERLKTARLVEIGNTIHTMENVTSCAPKTV